MQSARTYRIQTERLLIRCYTEEDTPLLQEAIAANLSHLHQWMPWINREPLGFGERKEQILRWRQQFLQGQDFTYGIFTPGGDRLIGSTGLHARVGPAAREIGYWIGKDFLRQGYATEAVKALLRTGFHIERFNRLEIHCSEQNIPSMAIPARLGFRRQISLQPGTAGDEDTVIWVLTRDDYSLMPYRYFKIKAFDLTGASLDFSG